MSRREIRITIPGALGGKGRPRFSTRGGSIRTYTPKQTVADEAIVRHYASEAMKRAKYDLFAGPLKFWMRVERVTPLSWSKKAKAEAKWITGKSDCDNQIKLVLDSMNKIVFTDDAQVSTIEFFRMYGQTNSVEICVTELT